MPCLHYGCNFRNENGFCKVTTCANPDYNGMTIRVANTIKVAPKTNADRIRAKSDEELVKHLACQWKECKNMDIDCDKCLLEWLKQEAET